MKNLSLLLVVAIALLLQSEYSQAKGGRSSSRSSSSGGRTVQVRGHMRNGHWVQPHTRNIGGSSSYGSSSPSYSIPQSLLSPMAPTQPRTDYRTDAAFSGETLEEKRAREQAEQEQLALLLAKTKEIERQRYLAKPKPSLFKPLIEISVPPEGWHSRRRISFDPLKVQTRNWIIEGRDPRTFSAKLARIVGEFVYLILDSGEEYSTLGENLSPADQEHLWIIVVPDRKRELRNWYSRDGKESVLARVCWHDENQVTIERQDSLRVTMDLEKLSQADIDYVKNQSTPACVSIDDF